MGKILKFFLPKGKDRRYLSEEEIVKSIVRKANKKSWDVPKHALILAHHTTGRAIRNEYKLWYKDNPYVNHEDEKHDNFPDQMSQRIMNKVWKEING